MKGIVEVFIGDSLVHESTNLVVDSAAESIVNILTTNPALELTEASAVLDASNYAIQAITFGKEAESYNLHAHDSIYSALVLADGIVRVLSGPGDNIAHDTSATEGVGLHPAPNPIDTRLEERDTSVDSYSGTKDTNLGHNGNFIEFREGNSEIIAGCYPASGGTTLYLLSSIDSPDDPISSFTYLSPLNFRHYIDPSGYIRMDCSTTTFGETIKSSLNGRFIKTLDSSLSEVWDYPPTVAYQVVLDTGDFVFASVFGGLKAAGLWTIDIKQMVSDGILPPYDLMDLENNLKFKLFSKKIFSEDLARANDFGGLNGYQIYALGAESNVQYQLKLVWKMRF